MPISTVSNEYTQKKKKLETKYIHPVSTKIFQALNLSHYAQFAICQGVAFNHCFILPPLPLFRTNVPVPTESSAAGLNCHKLYGSGRLHLSVCRKKLKKRKLSFVKDAKRLALVQMRKMQAWASWRNDWLSDLLNQLRLQSGLSSPPTIPMIFLPPHTKVALHIIFPDGKCSWNYCL